MTSLKFALRQLFKHPGFTAVAVLVLALGIGANSAIFSLIHAFLFRPIVAHQPDRLVGVYSHDRERDHSWRPFSIPNFRDLQDQDGVFDGVFAMVPTHAGFTDGDTTRRVFSLRTSANYFEVMGARPVLGRGFLPDEDVRPAPVVVVSHQWWQRRGASPSIVGESLRINGRDHTIVGVAPKGFSGTTPMFTPEFYFPLGTALLDGGGADNPLLKRDQHGYILVGRLRNGLTIEEANTRLEVVSERLAAAYPEVNEKQLLTVARLPRMAISTNPVNDRAMLKRLAVLLAGLAAAVLFIACLNLANMLLARGVARRKEIAVRLAIGASRIRIVRQLWLEALLLAVLGGAGGLLLAELLTTGMARSIGRLTAIPLIPTAATEPPTLLATFGVCVLTTLLFALGPAVRLVRADVNNDLKLHPGEDAQRGRRGLPGVRNVLVVGQVALSLALLVTAGLFGRSAFNAMQFNPGFNLDRGVFAELDPGLIGYDETRTRQIYAELLERLRQQPGVEAVSLAATIPLGEMTLGEGVQVGGAPFPAPVEAATTAEGMSIGAGLNVIGPDYFRTMGIPVQQGREFVDAEMQPGAGSRVAVINTTLAKQLWPDGEAIGRRIQIGSGGGTPVGGTIVAGGEERPAALQLEVVGVVPPQSYDLEESAPGPMLFLPHGQRYFAGMMVHVRARPGAGLEPLMATTREIIRNLDPLVPVLKMQTLEHHMDTNIQTWVRRMGALLFGALGGTALLLAMLGVYGVKAYAVSRRTREIGIRIAMGSSTGGVLKLFLRDGMKLTGTGLVIGLVLAIGVSMALAKGRFLYGVSGVDPLVIALASTSLALASLAACWIPARRVARIDPMKALRTE